MKTILRVLLRDFSIPCFFLLREQTTIEKLKAINDCSID